LCKELGIKIENRHRAAGDALATVKLLEMILQLNGNELPVLFKDTYSFNDLNPAVNSTLINTLPEKTGVYYFHNEKGDILYIGKSKNIRKRVISHLSNNKLRKAIELKNSLYDISYELTGSELIALLKESEEIKHHRPLFNRSQRRVSFDYGLYVTDNCAGYLCLNIAKHSGTMVPVTTFSDFEESTRFMFDATSKFNLCQKLNGLYNTDGSCFQYSIKQCRGACIGMEPPEDYNRRVEEAIEHYRIKHDDMLIIDKGRNDGERSVVLLEHGKYTGYGFIDCDLLSNNLDFIKECVSQYRDNRDVQVIIRNYLKKHKVEKILRL
jgi:DNA polymerase-3 subunit epsilon